MLFKLMHLVNVPGLIFRIIKISDFKLYIDKHY